MNQDSILIIYLLGLIHPRNKTEAIAVTIAGYSGILVLKDPKTGKKFL